MNKSGLIPGPAKFKQGKDYSRVYTRTYFAEFDPDDDEEYVRTHIGINIYTGHPSAPNAYVTDIELSHEEDTHTYLATDSQGNVIANHPSNNTLARLWTITLEFGPWNPIGASATGNPLDMPVWPRVETFVKEVPAYQDIDGNPIVNTAYDYFDPPVMAERLCTTITVARNEPAVNPYSALILSNRVNASAWNGFPPGTVKSAPIRIPRPEYDQQSGILYYPMEYAFEFDELGWERTILNQGFRQLDGFGKPVKIYDAQGMEVSQAVMLDNAGHALLPPVSSSSIVVKKFKVYPEIDFSDFNMDSLF